MFRRQGAALVNEADDLVIDNLDRHRLRLTQAGRQLVIIQESGYGPDDEDLVIFHLPPDLHWEGEADPLDTGQRAYVKAQLKDAFENIERIIVEFDED